MKLPLDGSGPHLVAVAGPDGAGKSTFYNSYLRQAALPFVNADVLAKEIGLGAYEAAEVAESVRQCLFERHESFIFETVFSGPAGGKLGFLEAAVAAGYNVVLCFIGVSNARVSEDRVAVRVLEGGHDVPGEKLVTRFPQVVENLRLAMPRLPRVLVYDNDDLREPHRWVAATRNGTIERLSEPVPEWLQRLLPVS